MVAFLSLLAYLLYALWVGRRSLAVSGKQTSSSSVNDVIHYECMIDIFVYSLYRIIELSRYGNFPEFFRKKSGKFPTFYFSGKVTTLIAILDTTAISEMRYAISVLFRIHQSQTVAVTKKCVCSSVWQAELTRPRSRRHEAAAASHCSKSESVVFIQLSRSRQSYFSLTQSVIFSTTGGG